MNAARTILDRALKAGLPPELVQRLERDLLPKLEALLARVPETMPADPAEETRLLIDLLDVYRPCLPAIVSSVGVLADAVSDCIDDLQAPDLLADASRGRAVRHLEEAICSLVRVGTVAAALVGHHTDLKFDLQTTPGEEDLPAELRIYLRGILALLVALERVGGELKRLVPWAWMARRELLKSEALIVVALQERDLAPPTLPKRVPGGWKGRVRIADDFDAPLPNEVEHAFYDSHLESSE